MEEEQNLGGVKALLLDWQLYHRVLQMQKSLPSDRWFKVTCLSMDLFWVVGENVALDEEWHFLFCLVSCFSRLALGHVNFEHDSEQKIVLLKWLYMLDCLASDPSPIPFPLVAKLYFEDEQWLPDHRQWQDLSPPWNVPCHVLTEKIVISLAQLEDCASQVEIFLDSWFIEESEDEYSDFLTLLMGWMLFPDTQEWLFHDEWEGPPLEHSEEAWTCWLWKVLAHWQNVIHACRPLF